MRIKQVCLWTSLSLIPKQHLHRIEMNYSIEQNLGGKRDSVKESAIACDLRVMCERDASVAIILFLKTRNAMRDYQRIRIGLQLANRVLRQRCHFMDILDLGPSSADPSTAEFWIRSLTPRLGIRRLLNQLRLMATLHPDFVESMIYWLRGRYSCLCSAVHLLRKLDQIANLVRESTRDSQSKFRGE